MKTTVIKVQEIQAEIEISYFYIKLDNSKTYTAKDKNRSAFSFETIKNKGQIETCIIFENGGLRFNRPVKILEYVK